MKHVPKDPDRYWLERPGSVGKLIGILMTVASLAVVADGFYEKHGHYAFERIFGFQAAYGFVSCVVLVLAATQMRKLVMRDEHYYEPADDQYDNPDGELRL